jgi:hypothetical protein
VHAGDSFLLVQGAHKVLDVWVLAALCGLQQYTHDVIALVKRHAGRRYLTPELTISAIVGFTGTGRPPSPNPRPRCPFTVTTLSKIVALCVSCVVHVSLCCGRGVSCLVTVRRGSFVTLPIPPDDCRVSCPGELG